VCALFTKNKKQNATSYKHTKKNKIKNKKKRKFQKDTYESPATFFIVP